MMSPYMIITASEMHKVVENFDKEPALLDESEKKLRFNALESMLNLLKFPYIYPDVELKKFLKI